jgi:hypothetical protein
MKGKSFPRFIAPVKNKLMSGASPGHSHQLHHHRRRRLFFFFFFLVNTTTIVIVFVIVCLG